MNQNLFLFGKCYQSLLKKLAPSHLPKHNGINWTFEYAPKPCTWFHPRSVEIYSHCSKMSALPVSDESLLSDLLLIRCPPSWWHVGGLSALNIFFFFGQFHLSGHSDIWQEQWVIQDVRGFQNFYWFHQKKSTICHRTHGADEFVVSHHSSILASRYFISYLPDFASDEKQACFFMN